jgi:predicted RNase H-like HicB family nuclease
MGKTGDKQDRRGRNDKGEQPENHRRKQEPANQARAFALRARDDGLGLHRRRFSGAGRKGQRAIRDNEFTWIWVGPAKEVTVAAKGVPVLIYLMQLTAVFVPAAEGGFTALIEEIPGAISEGESIEEARANLADALRMVLECNREIARQNQPAESQRESLELATL